MWAAVLSFAVPLAYSDWFVGPGNMPRWLLLTFAVPIILYQREFRVSEAHFVGILWIIWGAITLFWTTSLMDGGFRLWNWMLAGGCFCLGSALGRQEMRWSILAYSAGVALNLPFVAAQVFDVSPVLGYGLAGTMVNKNYLAEAGVAASWGLIGLGGWALLPLTLAAALIPLSKGAFFALGAVGAVFCARRYPKSSLALGGAVLAFLGAMVWHIGLADLRLATHWALLVNTAAALDITGYGLGSYWSAYPLIANLAVESPFTLYSYSTRPQNAHNDLLTIGFETGLIGLALFVWFLRLLHVKYRKAHHPEKLAAGGIVLAILFLGVFNFPLFSPATLYIGALAAGHLARD